MQRPILMAAALAAALCASQAVAQDYPTKPVRLIVPFPAGGSSDVVARFIAQGLSEKMGQQFVVENRAGAGGNLGTDAAAKAAPDGYTLGLSTSGLLANNKFLYKAMPYDSEKAFTPVVLVGEIPLVIVVNLGVPAKSLKELVDLARNEAGKLGIGHPGQGTIGHLALELFKNTAKIDLLVVPYKGDTPGMSDLMGGAIQGFAAPVTAFIPNIQAGKMRARAVTCRARVPGLPEVPTAAEQGVELDAAVWFGVVGPAGMARPLVDRLNAEINRLLASSEGRAQLTKYAALVAGGPPERMGQLMATDAAKWKRVIAAANITLD